VQECFNLCCGLIYYTPSFFYYNRLLRLLQAELAVCRTFVSANREKKQTPGADKKKQKNRNNTMKKIILTTAIILTAFVGAFAQSKTATANLSVTINPLQTIQVINPDVNLSYSTTDHYKN